jgi:hypothetical protein
LHSSEITGRLAVDLGYDDVTYATDAARRLLILESKGIFSFFGDLIQYPPHSLFSTILALIGFIFGGLNEFSLYASNIIILLTLVVFIGFELSGSSGKTILIIYVFLLLSPLSMAAIKEFRPDIALGLCSSIMVFWYLKGAFDGNKGTILLAGCAFGIALLVKPTFFAHTLALALLLTLITAMNNILEKRDWHLFPRVPKVYIVYFWGIAALISLPYVALNGIETINYFWNNTRGKSSFIWSFKANTGIYELAGAYYQYIFALQKYYFHFTIFILFVNFIILYRYKKFIFLKKIVLLSAIAFCSLVIIVFGRHKNEFFLSTFLWLLLISAGMSIVTVYEMLLPKYRKYFLTIFLVSIFLICAINSQYIHNKIFNEAVKGENSWNEIIFNSVRRDFELINGFSSAYQPKVFFTFAGPVNGDTFVWIGYRTKYLVSSNGAFVSNDIKLIQDSAIKFDYVVVPNPENPNFRKDIPSGHIQFDVLSWFLQNPSFAPIYSVTPEKNYYVFRNRKLQDNQKSVINSVGLLSVEGFLNEEGPYPQWSLPRLRWMNSSAAKICTLGSGDTIQQISFRARSEFPGNLEIINDKGETIGKLEMRQHIFQDANFLIQPNKRTSCYRFRLNNDEIKSNQNQVLFTNINFLSNSEGSR